MKTKEELFNYLRINKELLTIEKKQQFKKADGVNSCLFSVEKDEEITKAKIDTEVLNLDSFKVIAVINTTNLMDSHNDVHIPGLWNKTLKEQRNLYLLQEHDLSFKSIISDNVIASIKNINWTDLGYTYQGKTQALLFNAEIIKGRNDYMAEMYAKGYVKNHSVGMRYVKVDLAMNSDSKLDVVERGVWEKYINQIVNMEQAIELGYFWAVTEAKLIEGSAVPLGSNFATPTISVGKQEPEVTTLVVEPEVTTQLKKPTGFEIFKIN